MASERNNQRLVHLAGKLEELTNIPGYEFVVERLGVARECPGALSEMDFILRLKHNGFPIEIPRPRGEPIPDILTILDGKRVEIEVTSVREEDDIYGLAVFTAIQDITSNEGTVVGGIFGRVPKTKKDISKIVEKIRDASKKANATRKSLTVNLRGTFTLYVAPKDLASEIPEQWRGSIEMKSTLPTGNKLVKVIQDKGEQLSDFSPTILVV